MRKIRQNVYYKKACRRNNRLLFMAKLNWKKPLKQPKDFLPTKQLPPKVSLNRTWSKWKVSIKTDFEKIKLNEGIDVVSFLAETNIFSSKGEARKTIQGGGCKHQQEKSGQHRDARLTLPLLLHEKYILVQKGKKNYHLVKLV
jgi:hypothetical protein